MQRILCLREKSNVEKSEFAEALESKGENNANAITILRLIREFNQSLLSPLSFLFAFSPYLFETKKGESDVFVWGFMVAF